MDPKAVARPLGVWIAPLAMALIASGGGVAHAQPPPGEASRGIPVIEAPSAAEIRAALLAVEYWSDPNRPKLPDHLRPIPLDRAARILAEDARRGPYGASRRNRAIVKLTLAGLSFGPDGRPVHAHRQALEILSAPLDRIDALILELAARPLADRPLIPTQLGIELLRLLLATAPGPPPCASPPGPPSTVSELRHEAEVFECSGAAPKEAEVVATTSLPVKRSFHELAQLIDPQNWDAESTPPDLCNVYFDETKVVKWNDQIGDWETDKCPPTPGSAWSAPLQERFLMEFGSSPGSLTTSVTTVLDIDAKPSTSPSKFEATYDLRTHIFTNIGSDTRGGIDVDKGRSAVGSSGSATANDNLAGGEKRLRFTGWKATPSASKPNPPDDSAYYNSLACYSLKAMGDALAELLCCPVPPPPVCERPNPMSPPILLPP